MRSECLPDGMIRALAIVVGLLAAPAMAQNDGETTADLRPLWKQGQTSRYRVRQTEVMSGRSPGSDKQQQQTTELAAEVNWRVTEAAEDGGGVAELTFDSIEMTVTRPDGQKIQIPGNGDGERTKAIRQWIDAMTGTAIKVEVDSDGSIAGVDGYQAIRDKAGDRMSKTLDEAYFREIARELAVLAGGRQGAEPGDDWDVAHTGSHRMGEIQYASTYHFKGIERIAGIRVALVHRESDLTFEPDLSNMPENAPKPEVRTTEATAKAQIMYDLSRHEVVGANYDQTLAVQVDLPLGERTLQRSVREMTNTQILRISEE